MIMKWFLESNRPKHFIYAIGMEFKDKQYGGKWDWLDLIATIMGGFIGQLLQLLVIYIILKGGDLM